MKLEERPILRPAKLTQTRPYFQIFLQEDSSTEHFIMHSEEIYFLNKAKGYVRGSTKRIMEMNHGNEQGQNRTNDAKNVLSARI